MAFDGTLKFDTAIDQSGFSSGLEGIGNLAKSSLSGIGDIAKTGIAAVTAAITAASGAVVGLGAKAIAVGKEFEAGMSQVQATLGISVYDLQNNIEGAADTMQLLTEKAEEMGATTKYTAAQAAEGLNILAMSGYDAAQSVSMIDSTLSLAAAGGLQLGNAAQYITGSMKGFADEAARFRDETEASTYYADMIAKGATLAATNVDQLGAAMSGAAAIASSYGQTSQTTEVALLRLAEQGEVGSNAATMLSAAMKNIYTPLEQAQKAMDRLGVKAYDETGKVRNFNTVVDELHEALSAYSPEEASKLEDAIFGIQGKEAFDKMIVSSQEKVQGFYDSLAYTEDGAMGSAAAQAEAMMDNLQGDIQLFESSVDGLYNSLYKSMNGTLRELVKLGNGYITALDDAFKTGGFDGAAEKLGSILSDALDHIGDYLPDVVSIGSSIVASLLDGISENSGSIIETGLDMGFKMLSGFGDITVNFLELGANLSENLASGIETKLPKISGTSREILLRIIKAVGENLPTMLESGADIVEMLSGAIAGNLDRLTVFGNWTVRKIAEAIKNSLPDLLQAGADLIGAFGNSILDSLPVLLECAVQIVDALVGTISNPDDLSALIGAAALIVTTLGTAMLDNLQPLLNAGAMLINALISTIAEPDSLSELLNAGVSIIMNLVDILVQNADPLTGAAVQIITVFGAALISNALLILEAAFSIANTLIQALSNPEIMTGLLNAALIFITSFGTLLVENLSPLLGAAIQIIATLGAWIGEHALDLVSAGLVIVQALVNAVIQNLPLLLDAAVQIVEGLARGIEDDSADVLLAIENIIRTLLDFLLSADTLQKIGETGGKIIRALIPAAIELTGDLLVFAWDMFREFQKVMQTIQWGEIGAELVSGLIGGIIGTDFNMDEFFRNFNENWVMGFAEIFADTVQGFKDFWDDIIAIDWKQLGNDIIGGILSGITDMDFGPLNGVRDSLVSGMKKLFEIESPSKLMKREVGEYLGLGTLEGFAEGVSDIGDAAAETFKSIPKIPLAFDEPELPELSDISLGFDEPETPEIPKIPLAFDEPELPELSDISLGFDEPEMPEIPKIPLAFDEPELPELSDISLGFDEPETPEIPKIPLAFDEPELPKLSDISLGFDKEPEFPNFDSKISVSLAEEAAAILASFRQPQISDTIEPAALKLFQTAPPTAMDILQPSPTASITNNYTTNNSTATTANSTGQTAPGGDIIIPVIIGGEQLETLVITAAQMANARSGGGTI